MKLNKDEYLKKVAGCWMGKNIGGTVGEPFEWYRQMNNITFYTRDMDGTPMPNDDLDIQLLWLIAMERQGVHVDAQTLGEYWLDYVSPHWAEYGNGKINMRSGLMPPLSGTVQNDYKDSCGSFIRSEIWACICPGAPLQAAKYAYEDSSIDHGNGEGTYAEIFTAALESAAFVKSDIQELIHIGLHFIPKDCSVALAVQLAMECYHKAMPWQDARDEILTHFRGAPAYNSMSRISQEDIEKGFADGKLGWDVPSNIGMLIIGLLYSENDFEKCMCITVNCGEDTDCTAATAGSILGIINGIDYIPEKWIRPIGRSIKTIVLNLGDLQGSVPQNIDDLTRRTVLLADKVIDAFHLPIVLSEEKTDTDPDLNAQLLPDCTQLYAHFGCPVFTFDMLKVTVDYGNDPYIKENIPKDITLHVTNRFNSQQNLDIKIYADEDIAVSPSRVGTLFVGTSQTDRQRAFKLTFSTSKMDKTELRAVIELTLKGRHTTMLIPIFLLNAMFLT